MEFRGPGDAGNSEVCWTRALELRLVGLVREREVLWRPRDNTNHNIHLKYKAYAELARLLHPQATARAVRDRWVNIRSTFNHNVRKVTRSLHSADVYVPSWPLWHACQFLNLRRPHAQVLPPGAVDEGCKVEIDEHAPTTRARRPRAPPPSRPRLAAEFRPARILSGDACRSVLRELVRAARPLYSTGEGGSGTGRASVQAHRWLGLHVAERLVSMRPHDAAAAARTITHLLRANT